MAEDGESVNVNAARVADVTPVGSGIGTEKEKAGVFVAEEDGGTMGLGCTSMDEERGMGNATSRDAGSGLHSVTGVKGGSKPRRTAARCEQVGATTS